MSGIICPPLAIFLLIAAVGLIGWSAWPKIQQKVKVLVQLLHRKQIAFLTIATVVLVIIVVVVIGIRGPIQKGIPVPTPASDWQWSHPSPQDIFSDIDALPPYLQETARQNYIGLSVTWGVTLFSTSDSTDGLWIYALPLDRSSPGVTFTIDTNAYPQIKTMPKGHEFTVQGVITSVDSLAIHLGDCHLTFP